jgi:hypothetical protein
LAGFIIQGGVHEAWASTFLEASKQLFRLLGDFDPTTKLNPVYELNPSKGAVPAATNARYHTPSHKYRVLMNSRRLDVNLIGLIDTFDNPQVYPFRPMTTTPESDLHPNPAATAQ